MLVIRDPSSLSRLSDSAVRDLIRRRMDEYGSDADLATFIVVEPGDPLDSLDTQLGFPILANRFDGRRYGDPEFRPSFELAEDHGGFYEVVSIVSDLGDGVLVFIPKHDGVEPRLLSLCAEYATPEES